MVKFLPLFITLLLAGYLELIIFNEEVLLTLCFVSFIIFVYNFLGATVLSIFSERANKFETDLLVAFRANYQSIMGLTEDLTFSKILPSGLGIFEVIIGQYNNLLLKSIKSSRNTLLTSKTMATFNEVILSEKKIKANS